MAIGKGQTVWVLGAGFSKALGGPLLVDLFRQQPYEDLVDVLGTARAAQLSWTQALYNFGKKQGLWEDAEDFLVYAEAAWGNPANPSKRAFADGILKRNEFVSRGPLVTAVVNGIDFTECRNRPLFTILHAFGTEASQFLKFNPVDQEQWKPYLNWARHLDPERDSIITFNYDTVLETLELEFQRRKEGLQKDGRLQILMPKTDVARHKVRVLKLHGSADWTPLDGNDIALDSHAVEKGAEVLIAAPGRSKADLTSTRLKPLWDHARARLKHAAAIVIVGYGFPKTDAQARMELLDALAEDNCGEKVRQVHLVLGPDINLPTHRRMLELVRHRLGRLRITFIDAIPSKRAGNPTEQFGAVVRHPLWAEDFIGDYISRTAKLPFEK